VTARDEEKKSQSRAACSTTIPILVFLSEYGDQKLTILQGFMVRGGVEPPTPRFSVKTPDAVIWPWLQGLS
jgi:hypothetical protein